MPDHQGNRCDAPCTTNLAFPFCNRGDSAAHEITHQFVLNWHANVVRPIVQVTSASQFKVSGHIVASDGLIIESGSWIVINPSETGYKALGTLASYGNNPDGTCSITMSAPLSPAPIVGDSCQINSNSLMSSAIGEDVLCPMTVHKLRSRTASPLE